MGQKLKGKPRDFKPTPTVRLKDKEGARFIGRFLGKKKDAVPTKRLPAIYEFAAIGGDAPISIKTGPKQFQTVDVNEGDTIALFGTTVLDNKLEEAEKGRVLAITYLGIPEGKAYQDYDVEDVTEDFTNVNS